jgi:hypothetical protein
MGETLYFMKKETVSPKCAAQRANLEKSKIQIFPPFIPPIG